MSGRNTGAEHANRYAPRTRAGLLVSCLGFGLLGVSPAFPAIASGVSPVMGIGFVVVVALIAWLPRLVPPGRPWIVAPIASVPAASVYAASAVAGLTGLVTSLTTGTAVPALAGVTLVGAVAVVAAVLPAERVDPQA